MADVPDLSVPVAQLQAALLPRGIAVTLWGFQLTEGADQADQLHLYLRRRLAAIDASDEGMGYPTAFDRIPLEAAEPAGQPPGSSAPASMQPAAGG